MYTAVDALRQVLCEKLDVVVDEDDNLLPIPRHIASCSGIRLRYAHVEALVRNICPYLIRSQDGTEISQEDAEVLIAWILESAPQQYWKQSTQAQQGGTR